METYQSRNRQVSNIFGNHHLDKPRPVSLFEPEAPELGTLEVATDSISLEWAEPEAPTLVFLDRVQKLYGENKALGNEFVDAVVNMNMSKTNKLNHLKASLVATKVCGSFSRTLDLDVGGFGGTWDPSRQPCKALLWTVIGFVGSQKRL